MLYFFHHYELPAILHHVHFQMMLRVQGGMLGVAGGAYHDAPGTATQASPRTTQSTTQTTPSVSTVQTNTTHTGDVVSPAVSSSGDEVAVTTVNLVSVRDEVRIRRNVNQGVGVVETRNNGHISNSHKKRSSNRPSGEGTSSVIYESDDDDRSSLDRRRKECDGDPPLIVNEENAVRQRRAPTASPEADNLD